jgi:hypothetical protein
MEEEEARLLAQHVGVERRDQESMRLELANDRVDLVGDENEVPRRHDPVSGQLKVHRGRGPHARGHFHAALRDPPRPRRRHLQHQAGDRAAPAEDRLDLLEDALLHLRGPARALLGGGRQGCPGLSEGRLEPGGQRRGLAPGVKVDVQEARRLVEQMVVDREDLDAVGLELRDGRVDLRGEQDEIAHGDRLVAVAGRLECGPGAEREGWLDRNTPHRDAQIGPRPAKTVDSSGKILSRLVENPVERRPPVFGRGVLGRCGGGDKRADQQSGADGAESHCPTSFLRGLRKDS